MVKLRGEEDYPIYFGAGPELLGIASDLRKAMTPAEKERDEQRTMILKSLGIQEIRFSNEEVMNNTHQVIKRIEAELSK